MNPGKLAYLLTDIIFAGGALALIWYRQRQFFKKHWRFVMGMALFSLPFGYIDIFALKWGAWSFDPRRNLGLLFFGVQPVEDYLFMALITAAVAAYTISHAKVYEYKQQSLQGSAARHSRSSTPQKLIPDAHPIKY